MAQPITAADQDVVLRAEGVDLVRGGRLLLDQVTLTVRAGELWALLGPNGAGKSTLLRLLATYAHPTRGQVDILGQRLGRVDVFTLRPLVGLVTSHHRVPHGRTVRDVVLTGATGTIDLMARWQPAAADLSRADAAIEVMGLGSLAGARWPVLSQGERGRTLIARALVGQPRVLLLDEPAAGLDLAGREQLLASLDDLRERQPALATVVVTHHLEELPASTSHALLLRDGTMVAAGPASDTLTSDLVSACFGYPVTIASNAGRWTCTAAVSPAVRARKPDPGRDGPAAATGASVSG
ncbi:MAG TPA: ATP-binding cassette domain-containing protein [Streptosporangiaceae bacterium]|nr:ATP-binding cassette domain-containing protein [Streptosporangiaceae bacterium]